MTVTTIGYGDLGPQNLAESWICTTIMFLGCCIYAYLVGSIVSSLSGANPAQQDFRRDLAYLTDLTVSNTDMCGIDDLCVGFFLK